MLYIFKNKLWLRYFSVLHRIPPLVSFIILYSPIFPSIFLYSLLFPCILCMPPNSPDCPCIYVLIFYLYSWEFHLELHQYFAWSCIIVHDHATYNFMVLCQYSPVKYKWMNAEYVHCPGVLQKGYRTSVVASIKGSNVIRPVKQ